MIKFTKEHCDMLEKVVMYTGVVATFVDYFYGFGAKELPPPYLLTASMDEDAMQDYANKDELDAAGMIDATEKMHQEVRDAIAFLAEKRTEWLGDGRQPADQT